MNVRRIISGLADAAARLVEGELDISRVTEGQQPAFESIEVDGMTAACHGAWPADAQLLSQWNDLSMTGPAGTPFHSPAWQEIICRPFAAAGVLRIVTVHRSEQLAAVIPLALDGRGTLQSPGAAASDYLDPLIRDGCEAQAIGAALALLRQLWDSRLTQLVFHNVREWVPSRHALATAAQAEGVSFEQTVVEHAPALKLPGSWDQFLADLDPHERKETRRKLNKAQTKGNARLMGCSAEEQIGPALEVALRLMEACGGDKGDAVRKSLRPLLEMAAPALVRDKRMEIRTLLIGDQPAACLLQFSSPAGPLLYNCGVDYTLKEWSPGVVAVTLAIQEAISARHAVYDMLRGQEPYKYRLGAADRSLCRMTLRRKESAG